jgi:transposase
MSVPTIAPYFPFRRIKIINQVVTTKANAAHIQLQPNKRFTPICHGCGCTGAAVHSWTRRRVRDLNMASAQVWLDCRYRKIVCSHCQSIHTEDLELFHPYVRVTRRMAHYIYQLCQHMTVSEVARHLDLDWKTVKNIDKYYLERDYGQPDLNGLNLLAVDEISIRKGHRYLTVVLDYRSGRVVFVGKDRRAKTLERFFDQLNDKQLDDIKAVVMDMWDPFIKAVKNKVPHAKIVFDLFHVVANFNQVINKVRNREYKQASEENKAVYKGTRYLLLKNRENLKTQQQRQHLKELLELNKTINTVMILKDKLKYIWTYQYRAWATKALDDWCELAQSLNNPSVNAFSKMLNRYRYGILNHCAFPISTGKLEGVNNKIKVIKRKSYGFHDLRYFTLKIYQNFSN